jgi:carbamoyltransferase
MGFGGSEHDFSAALMRDTDVCVAVESERVTRVKYGIPSWFEDPLSAAARYCLETAGIGAADVTRTVSSDFMPRRTLERWSIHTFGHHLCHAASAAMLLPSAARACVLVYDGAGSSGPAAGSEEAFEAFSFYELVDGQLELLGATSGRRYPEILHAQTGGTNSLGQLYELVTTMIGFDRMEAGKTMGLAGWGRPRFLDEFLAHIRFDDRLDDVFAFDPFADDVHAFLQRQLNDERHSFAVRADLAATVQEIFTRCLLHCYELVAERDFDVFAVAGGCGLNTVANGALAKRLPRERSLLVPPHAGDAGIALGSLWLHAREHTDEPFEITLRGRPLMEAVARPGRVYPRAIVRRAACSAPERTAEDAAVRDPEALAGVIAQGGVVGVFNGSSEIGPRALGGRSILADPRTADARERINRTIKHREPFRPLAPMVLAEHFDAYFAPSAAADPFMLIVADASDDCRRVAPAVVHIDGTARVQVVGPDGDPFLIGLLTAFHALTRVPILLNTSFNRRGEPIVETPDEAVHAFLDLGLDGLWLDGTYLYRAA